MNLLSLVGYIKRGKNRHKVFLTLDKPMIPSEIAKSEFGHRAGASLNIVSRALGELAKKGLVEVVNPEESSGRIYRRTKTGETVAKKIRELEK